MPDLVKVVDLLNAFERRLKCHLFDAAFKQPSFPAGGSVSQPHSDALNQFIVLHRIAF